MENGGTVVIGGSTRRKSARPPTRCRCSAICPTSGSCSREPEARRSPRAADLHHAEDHQGRAGDPPVTRRPQGTKGGLRAAFFVAAAAATGWLESSYDANGLGPPQAMCAGGNIFDRMMGAARLPSGPARAAPREGISIPTRRSSAPPGCVSPWIFEIEGRRLPCARGTAPRRPRPGRQHGDRHRRRGCARARERKCSPRTGSWCTARGRPDLWTARGTTRTGRCSRQESRSRSWSSFTRSATPYREIADIIVDTGNQSLGNLAHRLERKLEQFESAARSVTDHPARAG